MKRLSPTVLFFGLAIYFSASGVAAQQFENPPSADVGKVMGKLTHGSNYTVINPVSNDGFLNHYNLKTNYGQFTVSGHELMLERIRELKALDALEKTTQGKTFVKGLAKSASKPIELAVDTVKAPAKTAGKVISGVFGVFDRVAKGANNLGRNPDNPVASLIGVSSEKRALAVRLGVDPYTDFKPLATRLHKIARASALGGLTVNVGLAQAGTAGLIASRSATAKNLSGVILDKTAAQLRESNRTQLKKMGAEPKVIENFLNNKNYTTSDRTAIVLALGQLDGVKYREKFVARAAYVNERDLAFFLRRRAEMLAHYHKHTKRLVGFLDAAGFPLSRTLDGTVLILAPLDKLVWTRTGADAYTKIAGDIKNRKLGSRVVIQITGTATKLAKKNLEKIGWIVLENTR